VKRPLRDTKHCRVCTHTFPLGTSAYLRLATSRRRRTRVKLWCDRHYWGHTYHRIYSRQLRIHDKFLSILYKHSMSTLVSFFPIHKKNIHMMIISGIFLFDYVFRIIWFRVFLFTIRLYQDRLELGKFFIAYFSFVLLLCKIILERNCTFRIKIIDLCNSVIWKKRDKRKYYINIIRMFFFYRVMLIHRIKFIAKWSRKPLYDSYFLLLFT